MTHGASYNGLYVFSKISKNRLKKWKCWTLSDGVLLPARGSYSENEAMGIISGAP